MCNKWVPFSEPLANLLTKSNGGRLAMQWLSLHKTRLSWVVQYLLWTSNFRGILKQYCSLSSGIGALFVPLSYCSYGQSCEMFNEVLVDSLSSGICEPLSSWRLYLFPLRVLPPVVRESKHYCLFDLIKGDSFKVLKRVKNRSISSPCRDLRSKWVLAFGRV